MVRVRPHVIGGVSFTSWLVVRPIRPRWRGSMRRSLGHLLRCRCHIGFLVCINAGTGIKVRFFFRVQRLWASDRTLTGLLLGLDYINVDRHWYSRWTQKISHPPASVGSSIPYGFSSDDGPRGWMPTWSRAMSHTIVALNSVDWMCGSRPQIVAQACAVVWRVSLILGACHFGRETLRAAFVWMLDWGDFQIIRNPVSHLLFSYMGMFSRPIQRLSVMTPRPRPFKNGFPRDRTSPAPNSNDAIFSNANVELAK